MAPVSVTKWYACDAPCDYSRFYDDGPWTTATYSYDICAGPSLLQNLANYHTGWDKFEFLSANTISYTPPLVASNSVHCPITNLKIFLSDFTTNLLTSDNTEKVDFWVDGLDIKFNPRRVRTTMDFYIAGYTDDDILQDYFKMRWTICCDETFNPVGHFIISDIAYRLIMTNPTVFTFSSFTAVESNYLDITRYEIIHDSLNDGSSLVTYPVPGCADPCPQLQYDTSQITFFRFKIKIHYVGKNGYADNSAENPSGTYHIYTTWIGIDVQDMVV